MKDSDSPLFTVLRAIIPDNLPITFWTGLGPSPATAAVSYCRVELEEKPILRDLNVIAFLTIEENFDVKIHPKHFPDHPDPGLTNLNDPDSLEIIKKALKEEMKENGG